jgi:hypothetical protein
MGKIYLSNAFSLGMLPRGGLLNVVELTDKQAKAFLQKGFISAIGHESTAQFIATLLDIEVPVNRVAITLQLEDSLIVLQLQGRLPEGKVLSKEEIASIPYKWFLVELVDDAIGG